MMNIATTGQTQGMTSILIDRLSSIDVLKRPLHCSDLKKETIYIKDDDKWEQDSSTKPKMKSVLDKLTKKGIDAMPIMEDDPGSLLIDGTINLLWKINLTNVLVATKKEMGK